jgi:hypothetical protein
LPGCRTTGRRRSAEKVTQVERRAARDFEEASRTEQRDECDVGSACGDEGREQRPPRKILSVGNLEREDDAGERRTEHRRDPGGGARHHEHLGVVLAQALHESALRPRADGRAGEQRGSLVAERAARAQCRRTLEELRPEIPHAHGAATFVIRADVRVRRRRISVSRQSRHQHRHGQSHSWDRGRQRHRLSQHPREYAVAYDLVERGNDAAGRHADHYREAEHNPQTKTNFASIGWREAESLRLRAFALPPSPQRTHG